METIFKTDKYIKILVGFEIFILLYVYSARQCIYAWRSSQHIDIMTLCGKIPLTDASFSTLYFINKSAYVCAIVHESKFEVQDSQTTQFSSLKYKQKWQTKFHIRTSNTWWKIWNNASKCSIGKIDQLIISSIHLHIDKLESIRKFTEFEAFKPTYRNVNRILVIQIKFEMFLPAMKKSKFMYLYTKRWREWEEARLI